MGEIKKIFSHRIDDGLAVVTFDVQGEAVNTWTDNAMSDFKDTLNFLEGQKESLKGIIFISGKKMSFHAGADLNLVIGQTDMSGLVDVVKELNRNFFRLENLGLPTLAAINGPCLGGGYEFTLAMTARLATDAPQTVIGLPECSIGVLPGAGGTQRMPRLIGYQGIGMIVQGKAVPAVRAFEIGMIDRIISREDDLLGKAKEFLWEIIDGTVELKREQYDFSDLDSVVESVRKDVLKTTRGRELPAPMLALKSMHEGLKRSLEEAITNEEKYLIEIFSSPESKGSINTFFLKTYSDKVEGMITEGFKPKPLNKLAVLGFGTMGRGIIIDILRWMQVPVLVKDIPEALGPGKDFVRKILQGMADKGRLKGSVDTLCDLVKPVSEWTDDFKDVDLVVEAVFEDPAVKEEVYKELCRAVRDDCVIASNTSSISVTLLAKSVKNPERFGGTHFFSPVWMMQLLEIIRGEKTSPDTINNLLNFCGSIRKRPVVCNDYPGFVVNAMLFPYLINAFDLLESGVGMEKIDDAFVKFGLPVGPIKLADEVGLDVLHMVFTKSMDLKAPQTLDNVVKAGRFGRKKSGKGFYLKDGSVDPEVMPLIPIKDDKKEYTINEIQDMLYFPFVEVGKELLEKRIVNDPRLIDIGAIWGVGFPADKGGPMKWADITGLSQKNYGFEFYSKYRS